MLVGVAGVDEVVAVPRRHWEYPLGGELVVEVMRGEETRTWTEGMLVR